MKFASPYTDVADQIPSVDFYPRPFCLFSRGYPYYQLACLSLSYKPDRDRTAGPLVIQGSWVIILFSSFNHIIDKLILYGVEAGMRISALA